MSYPARAEGLGKYDMSIYVRVGEVHLYVYAFGVSASLLGYIDKDSAYIYIYIYIYIYVHGCVVIYEALCFDVAQGQMNGHSMKLELTRVR